MSIIPQEKLFRWKNRNVSEKVYLQKVKKSLSMKSKWEDKKNVTKIPMKIGRRFVDIDMMRNHLQCERCKNTLSMKRIVSEKKYGLASVFDIICELCSATNKVPTSNHIELREKDKNKMYTVNCRAALGSINSGIGCTHLNKILTSLNVPSVDPHLFKRHERVIGVEIEKVAEESCRDAALLERELTLGNIDKIEEMLPPELNRDFLLPHPTLAPQLAQQICWSPEEHFIHSTIVDQYYFKNIELFGRSLEIYPVKRKSILIELSLCEYEDVYITPSSLESFFSLSSQHMTNIYLQIARITSRQTVLLRNNIAFSEEAIKTVPIYHVSQTIRISPSYKEHCVQSIGTIRIAVSYDMAWSKRGAGRNYDSLNGYGCIVGVFSQKILDYGNRNRKCRKCDIGHPLSDHDCRRNFFGTAKAMESDLAVELMCNSKILKDLNMEIGIFVGDDDAASISKVRANSMHEIVKLSDKNHVNKGLSNQLYNLQKKHRQLSQTAIDYLKRCFAFAVAQNIGNSRNLANCIRAIPDHVFNKHDNCGSWCRYAEEEENYEHSTIIGGFTDYSLYSPLTALFNSVADNAAKFSHGASSQRNENINHLAACKASKARCYSLSESSDFRYAATVSSVNVGETYPELVAKNINLSPSVKNVSKFYSDIDKRKRRISQKQKTKEFKIRRKLLHNNRTALKYRKEAEEGESYAPAMGFLSQKVVNATIIDSSQSSQNDDRREELFHEKIVLFDLETSGLLRSSEILQIAALCDNKNFNIYVKPTAPIASSASEKNNLKLIGGELFYRGNRVHTVPLIEALKLFKNFLISCGANCFLTAHNCNFDKTRLLYALRKACILNEFESVIGGFIDTLSLLRAALPSRKNFSLEQLATDASLDIDGAHNAMADVILLHKILRYHNITHADLLKSSETLSSLLQKEEDEKNLSPLNGVLSSEMRRRLQKNKINFEILVDVFILEGREGITRLLSEKINDKPRVTRSSAIISTVVHFLEDVIV